MIFDWDGIVIDSHDQHERAWAVLADELGQPLSDGFFKQTFGMRNQQIIPGFTDWAGPGELERIEELGERKEVIYRELVRRDGIEPLPGVRELLDALDRAGVPRGVGSSTPRANIEMILDVVGLEGRFDAITAAEDVRCGKPDPEVFLLCAVAIGCAPERCVVFEDAHAGIEAALSGGMQAVAVTTTHPASTFAAAHLVVASLGEVDVAFLSRLVDRGRGRGR